jgi:hypothetical protein
MTFRPIRNAILDVNQLVAPVAVPLLPFAAFDHVTLVTPILSDALPDNFIYVDLVE